MKPLRLFAVLASAAVLLAAPLAPLDAATHEPHAGGTATGHAAHRAHRGHRGHAARSAKGSARASAWTREDPSFPFQWECRTIPYRVNLAGTPHRNLVVVRAAIAQIAAASGYSFRYAGPTSVVPFARGHDAMDQVPDDGLYIAWSDADAVPRLAGDVVGLGGPGASYNRVGSQWQVTSGGVVVDRNADLSTRMTAGPTLMSLLLHELGHAMGLGHSPSKANVMYEGLGPWSRPSLGPGDRAGLRDLGGC